MLVRVVRLLVELLDRLKPESAEDNPHHLRTGRKGEEAAHFFLRRSGYVIVARNWRVPERKGEIDLIGWEGDVLCFIEVKTRTSHDVKPAEAAVDGDKQRELRGMACAYVRRLSRSRGRTALKATKSPSPPARFDIVSVYYDREHDRVTEIELFRNAFPMA